MHACDAREQHLLKLRDAQQDMGDAEREAVLRVKEPWHLVILCYILITYIVMVHDLYNHGPYSYGLHTPSRRAQGTFLSSARMRHEYVRSSRHTSRANLSASVTDSIRESARVRIYPARLFGACRRVNGRGASGGSEGGVETASGMAHC